MSNTAKKLEGEKLTTGTAVKPFDQIRNTLNAQKSEFLKVLPGHISFEKFQRTVMTAILQNNDLIQADRATLLTACIKAATDGLLPDGRDAALVIFNSKRGEAWIKCVQYMPMYAGILKKVRQSGELSSVETHVVYEKDKFTYILGDNAKIEHIPYLGADDRGPILAAYCLVKLKDGSIVREVMTKGDIEKVRRASKAGSDDKGQPKGIWLAWYEEMARKTVFRRCAKWLPQNIELVDHVFENDASMEVMGQIEGGQPQPLTIEGESQELPEESKQPDLKAEVAKKKAEKKAPSDTFPGDKPMPKSCETCVGTGIIHSVENGQEVKGPCSACGGRGKV